MEVTDLVLEVRNPSKIRVGQIMSHYWVDVTLNPVFNGVGIWSVTLPNEHPLVAVLKTPGSGIVATGPSWVVSGPMVEAVENSSPADVFGTWTFSGYTDEIVLDDPLAFPNPADPDVADQPDGFDTRTGAAETLCHAYVNANIGPGAPAARRNSSLVMGTNGARGGTVTYSAAFEKLIEVVQHLSTVAGLGFRVYQVDDNIVYENYAIIDRTDQIRLDFDNGTLDSTEFGYSSPKATHAVIASVDEDGNRLFHGYSNATSVASSTEWGRRIERFIERKSAQDTTELDQIGNELMVNEGVTITSLKVTPSDQSSMRFGLDWYLGDRVSVTVGTQVVEVVVTEAVVTANSGGVSVAVRIGDPDGFDFESAIHNRVSKLEQRLSVQERESATTAVLERVATLEGLDRDFSNYVLNGAFEIWQRGTSVAPTSTDPYSADRWESYRGAYAAGMTCSRQTVTGLPGLRYAARIQRNSGNTSLQPLIFDQPMESSISARLAGKKVTLSFYARRGANYSGASNALVVSLVTGTGTDQNMRAGFSGGANPINTAVILTTSWVRHSFTVTLGTNINQIAPYFGYTPVGTAGTNDWFEITGVQLEIAETAKPFRSQYPSIEAELAACQRFMVRYTAPIQYQRIASGIQVISGRAEIGIYLPRVLRTTPVITISNIGWTDGRSFNATVSSIGLYGYHGFMSGLGNFTSFEVNHSAAGTAGDGGFMHAMVAGAYIQFSAEL